MNGVVLGWVSKCTLKQQTVLLSAIRGCDGVAKNDISKKFVRKYRNVILKDAAPLPEKSEVSFMMDAVTDEDIKIFLKQPDVYPLHWLMHFIHAIEIIGYNHPDSEVSSFWLTLYMDMCNMLHVNPESKEQNDERLKDNCLSDCWKA